MYYIIFDSSNDEQSCRSAKTRMDVNISTAALNIIADNMSSPIYCTNRSRISKTDPVEMLP